MHKLMDYICKELEELERKADKDGKLSMAEVEYIDKLAHIKKSLLTSEAMMEDSEYSGSMDGSYGSRSYRGNYDRSYYSNGSYAGGRGRNARRDSMGRYSREGGSYDGGYSMGNEDFRTEMQELMQAAPNNQIRQKLQRIVSEM